MKKMLDALDRFEEAVREHAWIGSKHPDDMESIETEWRESKLALLRLLRSKCGRRVNAISGEKPRGGLR